MMPALTQSARAVAGCGH